MVLLSVAELKLNIAKDINMEKHMEHKHHVHHMEEHETETHKHHHNEYGKHKEDHKKHHEHVKAMCGGGMPYGKKK
mgnify:FL=1